MVGIGPQQVSFSSSDSADRIGPTTDSHNGTDTATITSSTTAGTNRVSLAGLVSRTRKLGPGHYTMTLTATNSTGPSTPKTISFTVVK